MSGRRLVLGAVARAAGDGGIGAVARLTGASWQTVADGAAELASGVGPRPAGSAGRAAGGRSSPSAIRIGPALLDLVEESTRGDPESPLLWTTQGAGHLADELTAPGTRAARTRAAAAARQGFAPQALPGPGGQAAPGPGRPVPVHRRAGEGAPGGRAAGDQRGRQEEGAGRGLRADRAEWQPKGDPRRVRDHAFPDRAAASDPVRGLRHRGRTGFVNVGTDTNTAAFAAIGPPLVGRLGRAATRARGGCWSPATPAAPTATGPGPGRRNSPGSRPRPGWRSRSATSRPAPRSGTRSSTGCSATSPAPGGAGR